MTQVSQKRIELRQKQLKLDRQQLIALPAFRRVVQDFMQEAGLFRPTFAGEQTHTMAFSEGTRNAALRMLAQLEEATPNALALLQASALPIDSTSEDDPE